MTETFLRKRPAHHAGEIGLYADSAIAEDDLREIANGTDCQVKITIPANLKLLAFIWSMAELINQNSDQFMDREDVMDCLKVKSRFYKAVTNPITRQIEYKPKSMSRMGNLALSRLIKRMTYIVRTEILPGMKESELKREIEKMLSK